MTAKKLNDGENDWYIGERSEPTHVERIQEDCHCEACDPIKLTWVDGHPECQNMRMIVCAICGNKRCPHATDHRNACTNSNEPGQPGSSYSVVLPIERSGAPTPIDSNPIKMSQLPTCGDPSCAVCAGVNEIGEVPAPEDHVRRALIVREIRDLRDFKNEHPEMDVEIYFRINELLGQLGDDE